MVFILNLLQYVFQTDVENNLKKFIDADLTAPLVILVNDTDSSWCLGSYTFIDLISKIQNRNGNVCFYVASATERSAKSFINCLNSLNIYNGEIKICLNPKIDYLIQKKIRNALNFRFRFV
jgi:hypothetical protein